MRRANLLYLMGMLVIALCVFAGPAKGVAAYKDYVSTVSTGGLNQPAKVAVDSATGDVYVADAGNKAVKKFSGAGVYDSGFSLSVAGTPVGIAVTASNIFVGDDTNNCVWVYNKSGALADMSGTGTTHKLGGPTATALLMPNTITVAPSGHIFVVDGDSDKVYIYKSSGAADSSFGASGSTSSGTNIQCYFPSGLTMANSTAAAGITTQYFYLGDQGNYKVQKLCYAYNTTTKLITTVPTFVSNVGAGTRGDAFGSFLRVSDVVWDSNYSRLYVVDSLQMVVQIFSSDATTSTAFNYSGSAVEGNLNVPTGAAMVAGFQRLFVANNQSGGIALFDTTPPYAAPSLTVDSPATSVGRTLCGDTPYSINYTAGDSDSVATLYLFYDTDSSWSGGSMSLTPGTGEFSIGTASIAQGSPVSSSYSWGMLGVAPGTYYVRGVAADANNMKAEAYSAGTVVVTDSDTDGLSDMFECTYPTCADPNGDADGDGVINIDEQAYTCNPTNPDTDNDGLRDGIEISKIAIGASPTDVTKGLNTQQDLVSPFYNELNTTFQSRIFLANPTNNTIMFDVVFFPEASVTGTKDTVGWYTLAPNASLVINPYDYNASLTATKGSLEIWSDQPGLVGSQRVQRMNASSPTTYDFSHFVELMPGSSGSSVLTGPFYNKQQTSPSHFVTWEFVKNPGNTAVTARVDWYSDATGAFYATKNYTIQPHGVTSFGPHQTTGTGDKGNCKITVTSPADGRLLGFQNYFKQNEANLAWNDFANARCLEGMDAGARLNIGSTLYSPYYRTDGHKTWAFFYNPNASAMKVHVQWYDMAGNPTGTKDVVVNPGCSPSFGPHQAGGSSATQGSFVATITDNASGQPVDALGLTNISFVNILDSTVSDWCWGTELSTAQNGIGSVLYSPMFDTTSGEYRTEIHIVNSSASSVNATLEFFNPSGTSLGSYILPLNAHASVNINPATYGLASATGSFTVTEPTGSIYGSTAVMRTNPGSATVKPNIEDSAASFTLRKIQ